MVNQPTFPQTLAYPPIEAHVMGLKPNAKHGFHIHAGTDDLTSQPTGAAGARIAVAVIGVAKTE